MIKNIFSNDFYSVWKLPVDTCLNITFNSLNVGKEICVICHVTLQNLCISHTTTWDKASYKSANESHTTLMIVNLSK